MNMANTKVTLPAAVAAAVTTNSSAQVARAIASHLDIKIDERSFRNIVRRELGYTSGKHGDKFTWSNDAAQSMLDRYAAKKVAK